MKYYAMQARYLVKFTKNIYLSLFIIMLVSALTELYLKKLRTSKNRPPILLLKEIDKVVQTQRRI